MRARARARAARLPRSRPRPRASGSSNSTDAAQWITWLTSARRALRAPRRREPSPGCVMSPATASTHFSSPALPREAGRAQDLAAQGARPPARGRARASARARARRRAPAAAAAARLSTTLPTKPVAPVSRTTRTARPVARGLIRCRPRAGSRGRSTRLRASPPGERRRREHARQERLAQLADAVVVRERAARAQDLVARRALELGVDLARVLDALVVEARSRSRRRRRCRRAASRGR